MFIIRFARPARAAVCATLVAALGACAGLPSNPSGNVAADAAATGVAAAMAASGTAKPNGNGHSAPAAAAAAAAAAAVVQGQPRPFADVIKDAKETPGLLGLWQKDDRVWIEIAPDQFGKPFLFTANLSRGVGEQGVYGGMMLADQIVEFKRIGNLVQLIAKNYAFTGGANAPIVQGVKEGFTDSLVGTTIVSSQPHPERKSVLIEANPLLLTDIPVGERFTAGVHMRNYNFDPRNSSFEALRNSPEQSSIVVSAHDSNPKATLPQMPSPMAAPTSAFPRSEE